MVQLGCLCADGAGRASKDLGVLGANTPESVAAATAQRILFCGLSCPVDVRVDTRVDVRVDAHSS